MFFGKSVQKEIQWEKSQETLKYLYLTFLPNPRAAPWCFHQLLDAFGCFLWKRWSWDWILVHFSNISNMPWSGKPHLTRVWRTPSMVLNLRYWIWMTTFSPPKRTPFWKSNQQLLMSIIASSVFLANRCLKSTRTLLDQKGPGRIRYSR